MINKNLEITKDIFTIEGTDIVPTNKQLNQIKIIIQKHNPECMDSLSQYIQRFKHKPLHKRQDVVLYTGYYNKELTFEW